MKLRIHYIGMVSFGSVTILSLLNSAKSLNLINLFIGLTSCMIALICLFYILQEKLPNDVDPN